MEQSVMDAMNVDVCWAKLHRARVTGADLNYVGSITIDPVLLDAAGLFAGLKVKINNVNNGFSWETYINPGERGKGEIILNGPPARNFAKGDIVIILAYGLVPLSIARAKPSLPAIVFLDRQNRITDENGCL